MGDAKGPALITGGGVRVGRAIVLALAGSGRDVIVHHGRSVDEARATAEDARKLGVRAESIQADLRDPDRIGRMFEEVRDRFGSLGLLVNNAAIFPRARPGDVSVEAWDEVFATNARAPFLCAVRARDLMEGGDDAAGPSIVNIADVGAFEGWPTYAPYAASKAALVSLTRSLARAWAPSIRVNAVAPGPVLLPTEADDEARERAAASTAMKRIGRPEDVAEAVLYLARARYTTGEVVRVDGGYHLQTGGGSRE
ncbi:MAG: SDR family NAD(P)-dependent oxidoreductase [Gemmatimonadota bacterium]